MCRGKNRETHLCKSKISKKMKKLIQFILILFWSSLCFGQPVRNVALYLEVFDAENSDSTSLFLNEKIIISNNKIRSKGMQLIDVSNYPTGFKKGKKDLFISKDIFKPSNKLMLVNRDEDTMTLTLLNIYVTSFLKIEFKKGAFTIDFKSLDKSTLPKKNVTKNQLAVPDYTPKDWSGKEKKITDVKFEEKQINSILSIPLKDDKTQNSVINNFFILASVSNQKYTYSLEYVEAFIEDSLSQYNKKESIPIRVFKTYLRIIENKINSVILMQEIQQSNLKPTINIFQLELLQINFDDIDDLKLSQLDKNQISYFLSNINGEYSTYFYQEKFMQGLVNFERDSVNQSISFEKIDPFKTKTRFELKGFFLDTIYQTIQNIKKPVTFASEFIFLNTFLNQPKQISQNLNKRPIIKTEYGDYNCDGYEDYRTEELQRPESNWNYYIWDKKLKKTVNDSLLSSMSTTFNFETKKLTGEKYELKNGVRIYSKYEFVNNIFSIVYRKECVSVHDQSEESVCSIYKLINGKLEFVESYPTAE